MQIDRNNKADAWLAHSQREQSGRLTIFLGRHLAWAKPLPCCREHMS
jgi:hypothetical protein